MENKYSTSGIGEDIIRSFTQIASAELHAKTLLEKRISEVENGLISEEEMNERKKNFVPKQNKMNGYLSRYQKLVTGADKGAVLE